MRIKLMFLFINFPVLSMEIIPREPMPHNEDTSVVISIDRISDEHQRISLEMGHTNIHTYDGPPSDEAHRQRRALLIQAGIVAGTNIVTATITLIATWLTTRTDCSKH